ncbi:hypothetical protein AAFF_G00342590 [Aldrovandia affinis]|uniref:C1q domain-containing protein n=1 Tax=Aldrovandia affinis TaxID=143900 RepID=A0AAD7R6G9_9TELE|nr:hypothetical protein AAFF_G00342590 [Aldrovandia affinis]
MRGLVLLCLFGTVLGHKWDESFKSFEWLGSDEEPQESDPKPDSLCQEDRSSCECCQMLKQIHRVEELFNRSMAALQHNLKIAQSALKKIRAQRSAFSVVLGDAYCIGPNSNDKIVVYTTILVGDGYDMSTGVFTAPLTGLYSLAVTVYTITERMWQSLTSCATLSVNNVPVASVRDLGKGDNQDSASIAVVLNLKAGDRVFVLLPSHCMLCSDQNTFTGFLLYATD